MTRTPQLMAIEIYEKFLSLWKDADPGLPEVRACEEAAGGVGGELSRQEATIPNRLIYLVNWQNSPAV